MAAVMTAQRKNDLSVSRYVELAQEARKKYPQQYQDTDMETDCRTIAARETARDFALAMVRLCGAGMRGDHAAAFWNCEAPEDCRVVGQDDFEELRDNALIVVKFARDVMTLVDGKIGNDSAQLGDMVRDMVRDSRRFVKGFGDAVEYLEDVERNCK